MSCVHTRVRGTLQVLFVLGVLFAVTPAGATLLSSVQASDGLDGKILSEPNIGRSVAVAPDGTIYVAYKSGDQTQLRVARSVDRGASFQPSVAAVTYTAGGPTINNINIAVAANGSVYAVAVGVDGSVTLGTSFDGGQTFASVPVGAAASNTEVGVAADGNHVYVAAAAGGGGINVFSSSDGGATFPTVGNAPVAAAFWHLNVDPESGNVVVSGDTPSIFVSVSSDHGVTFGSVQNPAGVDFFSSTAVSGGPLGSYLFVGGAAGSGAVRIDLANYSSTALPAVPLTNSDFQAESLAADSAGNLIAGYVNGASDAAFVVSNDSGATVGSEIAVAGAARETVEINTAYGDVVFAYLLGGQVHVDVYGGLLSSWLKLTVTDGNAYARYGHNAGYLVTATNVGVLPAHGAQLVGNFSSAFDVAATSWSCIAGPTSACGQAGGSGGFAPAFDVAVGDTVSWVLAAPVQANATDDAAEFDVSGIGATDSDIDTLVLFRDSFDVPNGNGTGIPSPTAGN